MATINIIDLYDRFSNFFEIDWQGGSIYLIGDQINSKVDQDTVVNFAGKYFSYKSYKNSTKTQPTLAILQRLVRKQFEIKLGAKGYKLRKWGYCAYRLDDEVSQPHKDIFSIFKGFVYRLLILEEKLLLCVDPHLVLQTNCSIHDLAQKGIKVDELNDFPVRYDTLEEDGIDGYLIGTVQKSAKKYECKVKGYRKIEGKSQEETIAAHKVFPECRPELLQRFVTRLGSSYSIIDLQRRLSFLDSATASKDRLLATLDVINKLSNEVFPLKFGDFVINVKSQPIIIKL